MSDLRVVVDGDAARALAEAGPFLRADTEGPVASADTVTRRIESGAIVLWEDDEPVAMAGVTPPMARSRGSGSCTHRPSIGARAMQRR